MKEVRYKGAYIIRFYLHEISSTGKSTETGVDKWLPGAGRSDRKWVMTANGYGVIGGAENVLEVIVVMAAPL